MDWYAIETFRAAGMPFPRIIKISADRLKFYHQRFSYLELSDRGILGLDSKPGLTG